MSRKVTRCGNGGSSHLAGGGIDGTGFMSAGVVTAIGSIEVNGVRGALNADTGSGGIRAEGSMEGEWALHSSSGTVVVRLPSDAQFQLDARTSSGSIESDHPVTVHGLIKKQLQGEVRGGGPLLRIRTSSGRSATKNILLLFFPFS